MTDVTFLLGGHATSLQEVTRELVWRMMVGWESAPSTAAMWALAMFGWRPVPCGCTDLSRCRYGWHGRFGPAANESPTAPTVEPA